jgi:hypothetical protein
MLQQWFEEGMVEIMKYLETVSIEDLEADLKASGYYDNKEEEENV